jgi:hypothetical protein
MDSIHDGCCSRCMACMGIPKCPTKAKATHQRRRLRCSMATVLRELGEPVTDIMLRPLLAHARLPHAALRRRASKPAGPRFLSDAQDTAGSPLHAHAAQQLQCSSASAQHAASRGGRARAAQPCSSKVQAAAMHTCRGVWTGWDMP